MKRTLNIFCRAFAGLAVTGIMASCSQFSDSTDPYGVAEVAKDLSGVWKLKSVVRNDIDITAEMDFSQFALNMKSDGTYHIDNYLPFVVENDGKWTVDDPFHPFRLSFQENDVQGSVDVDLSYPVVNGKRSLSVSLSPGCDKNVYTYTMERIAEDK